MQIAFDIPDTLAQDLKEDYSVSLETAARDAFIIEGYRTGKLSLGEIAELLGFETRMQAERWLGQRGAHMNYGFAELESDRQTLAKLFGDTL